MTPLRTPWLVAVVAAGLAAAAAPVRAADPAEELAARIDRRLAERWAAAKVEPAPLADDAAFLRRVYLDVVGRIPSVPEAREFLDDPAPDKRRKLVDRLLGSPAAADHFARVWRAWLLPDAGVNRFGIALAPGFEAWLRDRLAANTGYDKMVRELITSAPAGGEEALLLRAGGGGMGPQAFAVALENKPENLAGRTARLFLGVRIECAQCHDHPQATWTREQFWGFASFFATGRRGLQIPSTDKRVPPSYLDGTPAELKSASEGRNALADWMTRPDNPYFAKAAVNRVWAYFFGVGLVEPVDDLSDDNRPSHPELLDELARAFAANKFDLRLLARAVVLSRAYQTASTLPRPGADDPRLFARRQVKGLSPEQFYDSLVQATGHRTPTDGPAANQEALDRATFLGRFTHATERPTEVQTSLLQALALMNGRLVADATHPERGETLAAVADAPFLTTRDRIEILFLATLTRPPRAEELATLSAYVESGGPYRDRRRALADVFWALLNGGEFLLNR
jgi:hypothetical protein